MIASHSPPLLDVQNLSISFGGLKAVQNLSLKLPARSLHGLIGPNGAGKTTVFNLLTGLYHASEGTIELAGHPLNSLKPYEIAAAGLARTFQNIRLFGELSVLDNVRLALHMRGQHSLVSTLLRTPAFYSQESEFKSHAEELLHIFDLETRSHEIAKNLPYGHQRQLEIVRALATQPKVLLLDEPAAGMNLQEKKHLIEVIRQIRQRFEIAILLIEHDMGLVMEICERITVLDHGECIAEGTPAEIQCNPDVIEAYLGEPPENLNLSAF